MLDVAEPARQLVIGQRRACNEATRVGLDAPVDIGRLYIVSGDLTRKSKNLLPTPACSIAVLTNLLVNASKYSPPDSCISISAGLVDGMLEFRVDDAGPGVPAEDRERIFEPFY